MRPQAGIGKAQSGVPRSHRGQGLQVLAPRHRRMSLDTAEVLRLYMHATVSGSVQVQGI